MPTAYLDWSLKEPTTLTARLDGRLVAVATARRVKVDHSQDVPPRIREDYKERECVVMLQNH